jgi:ribose/xylose/arabinose/galactoside ABC-type transport system permease subunit
MLLLLLLIAYGASRRALDWARALPAVPLVLFAGAAALMISYGRIDLGYSGFANASRYATLTVLGVIGLYQAVLALTDARLRQTALGLFAALVVLSLFGSLDGSFDGAAQWRMQRERDVATLRDLSRRPDSALKSMSYDPQLVRERAAILLRYRLSIFSE